MDTGFERGLIRTELGYIHYYAVGEGVPMFLLHNNARSGRMFLDTARRLSDSARVYAIDLPNYGASDETIGPLTMEVFVDAVHGVITELESGSVVIGGSALGSYISVEFSGVYPELIKGTILQSTPVYADAVDASRRHLALRATRYTDATGFPTLRSIADVERLDMVHAPLQLSQYWIDQINQDLISAGRRFFDGMPVVAAYDLPAGLQRINAPTLLIWGRDFLYAGRRDRVIENVRDARVALIDGAGIYPDIDNPTQYDAEIRKFLESLS